MYDVFKIAYQKFDLCAIFVLEFKQDKGFGSFQYIYSMYTLLYSTFNIIHNFANSLGNQFLHVTGLNI